MIENKINTKIIWPKTLEETIEYFEEIVRQLSKNSSLFSEVQDISNIECLSFHMRLLTYLKELKNIREKGIK